MVFKTWNIVFIIWTYMLIIFYIKVYGIHTTDGGKRCCWCLLNKHLVVDGIDAVAWTTSSIWWMFSRKLVYSICLAWSSVRRMYIPDECIWLAFRTIFWAIANSWSGVLPRSIAVLPAPLFWFFSSTPCSAGLIANL